MNRDQKAAVIDRVAEQIGSAEAVFAVDYRGLTVKQAVDLRTSLTDAGASFQVVKNTLTERAADKAGAPALKELLDGPTALTFVSGDAALAAKALATFRRQAGGVPQFKGGQLNGQPLSVDQMEDIARLPARDVLHGQFVGVLASPLTGLVRGLASLISGLAIALRQIEEQGLVGGGSAEAAATEAPAAEARAAEAPPAEAPADEPAAEAGAAGAPADPQAVPATGEVPAVEAPAAETHAAAEAPEQSGGGERESPAPEEAPGAAEPPEDAPPQEETAEPDAPGAGDVPDAGEASAAPGAAEGAAGGASAAPGDPVAEAEAAEESNAPGEGGKTGTQEG